MASATAMRPCPRPTKDVRGCLRALDHDGECGTLHSTYIGFAWPRRIAEYRGHPGAEVNGMALPPEAYDALATATMTGKPCELVVMGEQNREDGVTFLVFGVSTAFIEATTDWRSEGKSLRLICPECTVKDGKHLKSCQRDRR